MRERQVFDPESISAALRADLVDGLRAIADAIERKEVDGYFASCAANGFTGRRDDWMHLRVSFNVAAPIFRFVDDVKVRLDAPTLELPVAECGRCGGTGEVCYSSTSYGPCPACCTRKELA